MTTSQELRATQSQKLALTPEMRQSINILQMSCTELGEFLENEMMENPLLERNETSDRGRDEAMGETPLTIDWSSYMKNCASSGNSRSLSDYSEDEEYTFEKFSHSDMTYREVLDLQFNLLAKTLSPRQVRIGLAVLDHIRDDGYLEGDLYDLSDELDVELSETEVMLDLIQHFHPAGTGARSVAECLFLQLREAGQDTEEYCTLLYDYLEDIAAGRVKQVAKESGISMETQLAFLTCIRALHPKPGYQFAGEEKTVYVVPDGRIAWENGMLHVSLNSVGTPQLVVSSFYKNMLTSGECDAETKSYIEERMNRALLIIQNIASRENTILRIAQVAAEAQREYLEGRSDSLKPLTQKEVAEMTGLHESTISRTVRGKYFLTSRGTMELQSLFCAGFVKEGSDCTADSVKKHIRLLIQKEDRRCPLSDQKIADQLSSCLVKIARRTVAKYREELGIAAACRRKMQSA